MADARSSSLQWCLGLVLLGWGLSILSGIVPHEDLFVGAGLAVLGGAFAYAARDAPRLPRLHPAILGSLGALTLAGAIVFLAMGWDTPKAAIAVLGALLVAAAWAGDRPVRLGRKSMPASALGVSLLPMALGPAAIYAMQALFSRATGTTPLEAFLAAGLIAPVAGLLALIGWSPRQDGQLLTYMSPDGPVGMQVGVACSGLQAMALFAGMLAILIAVERPPPRLSILLVTVGLVGVYVANVLRIFLLAVVGYHWGPDALEQAHAQAGWVLFVAWAILFAAWAKGLLRTASPVQARAVVA